MIRPPELLRITAPHFEAGVEIDRESDIGFGVVTRAAPAVAFMRGWHVRTLEHYCTNRGWQLERVDEHPRDIGLRCDECGHQAHDGTLCYLPRCSCFRPANSV